MTVVLTLIAILAMAIIALSLGMWWDNNRAHSVVHQPAGAVGAQVAKEDALCLLSFSAFLHVPYLRHSITRVTGKHTEPPQIAHVRMGR
ncbi:MAG: hypothetical protein WCB05_11795 [Candidatus Sulfotelmatobacter sp.]